MLSRANFVGAAILTCMLGATSVLAQEQAKDFVMTPKSVSLGVQSTQLSNGGWYSAPSISIEYDNGRSSGMLVEDITNGKGAHEKIRKALELFMEQAEGVEKNHVAQIIHMINTPNLSGEELRKENIRFDKVFEEDVKKQPDTKATERQLNEELKRLKRQNADLQRFIAEGYVVAPSESDHINKLLESIMGKLVDFENRIQSLEESR